VNAGRRLDEKPGTLLESFAAQQTEQTRAERICQDAFCADDASLGSVLDDEGSGGNSRQLVTATHSALHFNSRMKYGQRPLRTAHLSISTTYATRYYAALLRRMITMASTAANNTPATIRIMTEVSILNPFSTLCAAGD
jgi:hypothetical protein